MQQNNITQAYDSRTGETISSEINQLLEAAQKAQVDKRQTWHTIIEQANSKNAIRPDHYGGETNPHEPIKIIEHYKLGFHLGNAIKYILRAGKKTSEAETKDLKKAAWYIERYLQQSK